MDGLMDKIIEQALEDFDLCIDEWSANYEEAVEDLKFGRLGEQWPEAVRRQRELEQRPILTINKMPAFIKQVTNDARQNKPSIRVRPFDSNADIITADVYNGLIRNIESVSCADVAYDTAIDLAASCGLGYIRVDMDYACDDSFDMDIKIGRVINPFTVYPDPRGESADGSDWEYCFVTEMISKDEFKERYPNAETSSWDASTITEKQAHWISEDDVRIAEYWVREKVTTKRHLLMDGQIVTEEQHKEIKPFLEAGGIGIQETRETHSYKVTQYILSADEVLEKNAWPGQWIPIIPVYGEEIIVEGKRYFHSLIRQAKDAQRMFNYWRTASTELVALAPKAPFIGPVGAFDTDLDKWLSANTSSHAFLEYDGAIAPQRQPFSGVPAGSLQEALNASDDMKAILGLYDASLGARSNETSGKAIIARQREGDVSTFHFIDNLNRAIRHVGRVIIDLIPHVYTGQRVVRVLGQDGKAQNVTLNAPTTVQLEDNMQQQVTIDLSRGKYDLVVDTGPSFTTRREETAAQMTEFIRAFPQAAPYMADMLAKNLDWQGADELARRFAKVREQQESPEAKQQAAEAAMIAKEAQIADIETKKAQAAKTMAEAQKTMSEIGKVPTEDKTLDVAEFELKRQVETSKLQIEAEKLSMEKMKLLLEADRIQSEANMKALSTDDDIKGLNNEELQGVLQQRLEQRKQEMMMEADKEQQEMQFRASQTQAVLEGIQAIVQQINGLSMAMTAPKRIVKDAQGRPIGVEVDANNA